MSKTTCVLCILHSLRHRSLLVHQTFMAAHLRQCLLLDCGLVVLKLPRRHFVDEQLINFLKCPAFQLRHKEKEKQHADDVGPGPQVSIFCTLHGHVSILPMYS